MRLSTIVNSRLRIIGITTIRTEEGDVEDATRRRPRIMELIANAPWREAVTYRDSWPHEYVVVRKDGQEELLAAFCERIGRGEGVECRFFHQTRRYLFLDDHKYWIMVECDAIDLDAGDHVLNRARLYRDRRDFVIQGGDTGRRGDYPGEPARLPGGTAAERTDPMGDSEKPRTLLAQLCWRFHPGTEGLAVEALVYILDRYPASIEGLAELVAPAMGLSAQPFETEVVAPDGTRPDVLQRGDDGSERLFIEAKFYAPLTRNQPVPYLARLPDKGDSVLMFLAPAERVGELWPELLRRLDESDKAYSDRGSRCVAIDGTGKHLLVTDWTTLLDNMEERLKDFPSGLADLRQLRGLVRFAESGEGKSALAGDELVNRVTEIGKAAGWLHTRGLRAAPGSSGFGRYAHLGYRYKTCVWLGVNLELFEQFRSSQLWVLCDDWSVGDWDERVRPALKDRMSPNVHEEGRALWVPVVPEGSTRADNYAAALERIAGILDELVEA